MVNGFAKPGSMQLQAGEQYRFRFINMTPSDDTVVYSLLDGTKPTQWQPLAKDGADLPPYYRKSVDAKQMFGAGETYDYTFEAAKPETLSLVTDFGPSHIVMPIDVVAGTKMSKK